MSIRFVKNTKSTNTFSTVYGLFGFRSKNGVWKLWYSNIWAWTFHLCCRQKSQLQHRRSMLCTGFMSDSFDCVAHAAPKPIIISALFLFSCRPLSACLYNLRMMPELVPLSMVRCYVPRVHYNDSTDDLQAFLRHLYGKTSVALETRPFHKLWRWVVEQHSTTEVMVMVNECVLFIKQVCAYAAWISAASICSSRANERKQLGFWVAAWWENLNFFLLVDRQYFLYVKDITETFYEPVVYL